MSARAALVLLFLGPLAACGMSGSAGGTAPAPAEVEDPARGAGWTDLFDGATLDGWHGYASADRSPKWSIVDGVMTLTPGGDWDGDLVAPGGPYADFELEVEWWVQPCGNSGIFYRGEEDPALAPIWRTSLEAQILDDTCHPDGKYPSHRAGGLYDLYTPTADAPAEGGVWRTTRIVADGDRITHTLDGRTVVEAVQGSADWDARIAVSKFRDGDAFPGYGTRRSGFIGLQDHGDTLRVRSVRVRTL